jgi:hypothetical protein
VIRRASMAEVTASLTVGLTDGAVRRTLAFYGAPKAAPRQALRQPLSPRRVSTARSVLSEALAFAREQPGVDGR